MQTPLGQIWEVSAYHYNCKPFPPSLCRVYKAGGSATMLYGSKTWDLNNLDLQHLQGNHTARLG